MRPTYVQPSTELLSEARDLLVTLEGAMAHYQERIHSLQQRLGVALSAGQYPAPAPDPPQPSLGGGTVDADVPDVREGVGPL